MRGMGGKWVARGFAEELFSLRNRCRSALRLGIPYRKILSFYLLSAAALSRSLPDTLWMPEGAVTRLLTPFCWSSPNHDVLWARFRSRVPSCSSFVED